ncbi:TetR/AcrR family transcriptional regulator [Actinacidiphila yeochonensis]|uniref:TetR/AcrR family transcriptional regulator n=1 Tax=Actinacidiphila yeochonensis TaxID=89050 RepID=UPI00056C9623|nr:TetR/AcrR family transcriptional regulator [Actinacidiphila yeochonensis]
MPTGVAIRDVREQLFAAAERLLLRAGPGALTSRAVTEEAGCAKGVLHRHFPDFDAFLAELVLDRVARTEVRGAELLAAAGTGTVVGNVAGALTELFDTVAVAVVALVVFRDEVRARLRRTTPKGVPVLTEAARALARYLTAEREAGRIASGADTGALAPSLVGAAHLLFADRTAGPPDEAAVTRVVAGVLGPALPGTGN